MKTLAVDVEKSERTVETLEATVVVVEKLGKATMVERLGGTVVENLVRAVVAMQEVEEQTEATKQASVPETLVAAIPVSAT